MPLRIPVISKFDASGIRDAQTGLDRLGNFAKTSGAIVAGAFAASAVAVGAFAISSLKAADESYKVGKGLENAVKNAGLFGDSAAEIQKTTDALSNHAQKLGELTGIDDEVLLSMEKTWLAVPELAALGTAGIENLAKVTADVAAGTGIDVSSIGRTFIKVAGDEESALSKLSRMGVVFTDQQKEQYQALVDSGDQMGAQAYLVSQLGEQYKGAAEAAASPMDRLTQMWSNFQETIGTALMPALEQLIPIVSEVLTALTADPAFTLFLVEIGTAFGELVMQLTPLLDPLTQLLMAIMPPLMDLFAAIVPVIVQLADAFIPLIEQILPVIANLIDMLLPIFMELVNAVVMPLIPLVMKLVDALMPLAMKLFPIISVLIEALAPIFEALIGALIPLIDLILPPLLNLFTLFMPLIQLIADILMITLVPALQMLGAVFQLLSGDFEGAGATMQKVFEGMRTFGIKIVNDIIGVFEGMINFIINGVNSMINFINGIEIDVPGWVNDLLGTNYSSIGFNVGYIPNVSLPRLADGGIVMPRPGGILANIGEGSQPEAVIPLNKLDSMMTAKNSGATYVINVNGGLATGAEVGRAVVDAIKKFERVSGPVFAGA